MMMAGLTIVLAALQGGLAESPTRPESAIIANVAWVRAGPEGIGTGWIVDDHQRWLLTCRHLVGEQSEVELFFPVHHPHENFRLRADYLSRREALDKLGFRIRGKVICTSDHLDLAVVCMDRLPPGATGFQLARRAANVGATVGVIGQRFDLETLWNYTEGTVRQRGRLADGYAWHGRQLAVNMPAMILDLPIESGDSGSPVFDQSGQVLGMITGIRRTAGAAVAVEASAIREFLSHRLRLGNGSTTATASGSKKSATTIPEKILAATVWLQPTATQRRTAGVVISRRNRWILTSAMALGENDRIGVAFPLRSEGECSFRVIGERDAYADPVELWCRGCWSAARLLARDRRRDLALLQVDVLPQEVGELPLAGETASIADGIHAVSHAHGTEFVWTYARGVIRQIGRVSLSSSESQNGEPSRLAAPQVLILQLPFQSTAAGGPVVNDRGELLGVLTPRARGTMVAFAVAPDEVRGFLREQLWRDALEFLQQLGRRIRPEQMAAELWLAQASDAGAQKLAMERVLAMIPDHPEALLRRAEQLRATNPEAAQQDLDRILLVNPWHRAALLARGKLSLQRQQAKAAIADLNRWLDIAPGDAEFHCLLGAAWAAAGEEAKAFREWQRALRLDRNQRFAIAAELCDYLQRERQRFPEAIARDLYRLREGLRMLLPTDPTWQPWQKQVEMTAGSEQEQFTHLWGILQSLRILR